MTLFTLYIRHTIIARVSGRQDSLTLLVTRLDGLNHASSFCLLGGLLRARAIFQIMGCLGQHSPSGLVLSPLPAVLTCGRVVTIFSFLFPFVRSCCCSCSSFFFFLLFHPPLFSPYFVHAFVCLCGIFQADKLLSPEFQPVLEQLVNHCKRKRQICLFSATFPVTVKDFKDRHISNPYEINLMDELTLKVCQGQT